MEEIIYERMQAFTTLCSVSNILFYFRRWIKTNVSSLQRVTEEPQGHKGDLDRRAHR